MSALRSSARSFVSRVAQAGKGNASVSRTGNACHRHTSSDRRSLTRCRTSSVTDTGHGMPALAKYDDAVALHQADDAQVGKARERACEEAQATNQRHAPAMRLASTGPVYQAQLPRQWAHPENHEQGDGQRDRACGHQFCFFHARL